MNKLLPIGLIFLVGCVSHYPPKVTKLPQELPPLPTAVVPKQTLKAGVVLPARQVTLNIQYPYSEPAPIALEVWHSLGPISKPGGPTWSVLTAVTNGAPTMQVLKFGATNAMEWFQVRGRDPRTGWTGGWATVQN